jgi:hypothetical protein
MPRVLLLARSAFIGWIAMLVVWGIYVFLLPHRVESEIGQLGAFFVFGLVLSAIYIVDFFIITTPIYFLTLTAHESSIVRRGLRILCGGWLYSLSVAAWCFAYNTHAEWHFFVVAALAGAASIYALPSCASDSRERETEPTNL